MVPLQNASVLWDKTISTENRDSRPLPLLSLTFLDTRNFLQHRRVHHEVFWYCETTNFDRNLWYIPRIHKIFQYWKLSDTQNGSSTVCFCTVRQNNFEGKAWYSPPSISLFLNIFRHRRVPLRIFSLLCDQKIATENRDEPLLCIKFLDTRH